MKLLADLNVSRHVVSVLRSSGIDVTRSIELLDPRASDLEIIEEARRLGAVVISHDQDFSNILAAAGATTPSLINLRGSQVDPERIAAIIEAVMRSAGEDLEAGAIVTVDDSRIRIRRLPVG